jgi:nucleoside-diphosphate-sugar epimerase
MKILFIGGNGNISWYCIQEAINQRHEVWMLHRGVTVGTRRDIQPEVHVIKADFRDYDNANAALRGHYFDVVIDFICYNEIQAIQDITLFSKKTSHFIFISSGSVYERGTRNLPYKEDSPRCKHSIREYVNDKIKAENVFMDAYKEFGFPVTIVRPGYTYDTIIPVSCGLNDWTVCKRILEGKPVIILGDGSSLFTFTHSRDFAKGLMALVWHPRYTIGEVFNITSDERLNWKEATDTLVYMLGRRVINYVYIPTEFVCQYLNTVLPAMTQPKDKFVPSVAHSLSHMAEDFLSQKMWCDIYDNTKIKNTCSSMSSTTLEEGLRETLAWMNEKSERKRVDPNLNRVLEELWGAYERHL